MYEEKIKEAIKRISGVKNVSLEVPELENYGDFSSNIALTASELNGGNPRKYAEELVGKLLKDGDLKNVVSKIEVAGPGFINFWLSRDVLLGEIEKVLELKDKYGSSDIGRGKTVIIDYSSPNIAKRFSIGHLRSTVIGQALYNLHGFLGYKVIGDNHLGDWGTQFGVLLYQITSKGLDPRKLSIDELEKLYVEFHQEAEKDEGLWNDARTWFKKLESGDKEAREIWQILKDASMKEFEKVYQLLGVKIDHVYGESFYEDKMPEVIEEIREKGLSKKSRGAEVFEFKDLPPAMVIKSDGATTYFTRDLTAIKFRIKEWNPDIFIYDVGSEQILHFKQVFEAVRMLGWIDKQELVHVAHGLFRFKSGKISTRKGKAIKLVDVLQKSIEKADEIIGKSQTGGDLTPEERKKIAKAVGVGAIKYFDLMHQPTNDIIFDWNKIFLLEGNSAPYLQYTYARCGSVLRKGKISLKAKTPLKISDKEKIDINPEEMSVLRFLPRFSGITIDAVKNYSPNLLCSYLFDLARKYNNFYNKHRVIGSENEEFRRGLTFAVSQILKNGLGLLGIETPSKM